MDKWDALSPEAKLFQRAVMEYEIEENEKHKNKNK